MNETTVTTARRTQAVALLVALLAATLMVFQYSAALFSDSTDNVGNEWASGNVEITDNGVGSAMFVANDIAPGYSDQHCITVEYEGTVTPADVRLYASVAGPLAEYLDVTVDVEEDGTGAFDSDCTGFTADATVYDGAMDAMPADFTTGVDTWEPANTNETRTYRFSIELPTGAGNAAADLTADADFVWEARNQ